MHIFDTDTLSHLHAGNQNVIRAIRQLGNEEITTTIVTKIEMLRGRIDYIIKARADSEPFCMAHLQNGNSVSSIPDGFSSSQPEGI